MTADFTRKKRGQAGFSQSEPAFLLSVMDRRPDWCVVVCLIGEGQEINRGEAGIAEWMRACQSDLPHWQVFMPPHLLKEGSGRDVPITAPGARGDGGWRAPIDTSRDREADILASSNALRLKPEGLYVKADIDVCNWFLNPTEDVRSSNSLEDAATKFAVQGLELDWTCVAWDLNLRRAGGWEPREFRGTRWNNIHSEADTLGRAYYVRNAYRVLLTRARQGMVIFAPRGEAFDATRPPADYDAIDAWLATCGIPELAF